MHELKFRGQTRRYGEKIKNFAGEKMESAWAYGCGVTQGSGDFSIIYGTLPGGDAEKSFENKHVVYTDTLGQFTGAHDKHGTPIYEGDIIKGKRSAVYAVEYSETICGFVARGTGLLSVPCMNPGTMKDYEIIGNIHDNPELLEGEDIHA